MHPRLAIAGPSPPPTATGVRTDAHPAVARAPGAREISRGIAAGDEAAFEAFYRDWFEECFEMARALTRRDEAFCLDVVQESMLRAARRMRPMASREQLAAWMRRVVHRCALDRFRSERRRAVREQRSGTGEPALHETDERIEWLRAELERLGPPERSILMLRFGGGRSAASIAAASGVSPGAVKGKLRRLIERLRERAEEND
ncbi:MAG: RNA polymerase sigma factor [Planctomycetota bacterium]